MNRAGRYVGIGCGLFLLLGLCTTFVSCYVFVPMPARDAAQGFLGDVRGRDFASALQRTSAEYQSTHDAARLEQSVARLSHLSQHTGATFWNASFEDARATLDGTLATPDGDVPVGIELVETDGYWYVDQVVVRGVALE